MVVAVVTGAGATSQVWADLDRRVLLARTATGAADAKAGHLLSAAGVLAAAGGLWGGGARWSGPVLVLAGVAGVGLVTALVSLLAVLAVRGWDPRSWLLPGAISAEVELERLVGIVALKHRWLRLAVRSLQVAVLVGAAAVVAAGASR